MTPEEEIKLRDMLRKDIGAMVSRYADTHLDPNVIAGELLNAGAKTSFCLCRATEVQALQEKDSIWKKMTQ